MYLACCIGSGKWITCCWSRMASVTLPLWLREQHGRTQLQRSQLDFREGRTQLRPFFWYRELLVKLGADKSGAQWPASQNRNLAISGLLPERRKQGLEDSNMVIPLIKTNGCDEKGWGAREWRQNFVIKQLFCDWVRYHT